MFYRLSPKSLLKCGQYGYKFIDALECSVTTTQPIFIKLTLDWQIVANWYTDLYKNLTVGSVADNNSRPDGRGVQTRRSYFTS